MVDCLHYVRNAFDNAVITAIRLLEVPLRCAQYEWLYDVIIWIEFKQALKYSKRELVSNNQHGPQGQWQTPQQ